MNPYAFDQLEFFKSLLTIFLSLWQVWVILIILALIKIFGEVWLPRYMKKKKFNNWTLDRDPIGKLKKRRPNDFENDIAEIYSRLGYKTKKVGGSNDGGVDVEATKDGIKHYIQCKKYITSKVSVGDVRNFAGALMDKLSQGKGIFITTNIFTTEAEKYAEDKPIELVDGDKLLRLIKLSNKENEIIESKKANICPICGGKLREINGKFSKFMGCANYPNCKYTKKIYL